MPLKTVWSIVFALVSLAGPAPAAAGDDAGPRSALAAIKERGVLRVGIFAVDTPPFYFMDSAKNVMAGSDVDLAKSIARHLGVGMEIKRFGPPFGKLLESVDADEVDIIVSSTSINPERAAKYDTVIYDYTYFSFLLDLPGLEKKLGRELIEPADLDIPEVKILVQKNTPFEAILKNNFPNATPLPIDSNNNVGMMVEVMDRGEAHVAFDRDLVFLIYARTDPESSARFILHPLPDIMNSVGLLLKKNSDVTPVVQDYIDKKDEVHELSEIIDKYMNFQKLD
jgi:ABC-type amino acid transport/signal transduction systems, periplasmic component/domain